MNFIPLRLKLDQNRARSILGFFHFPSFAQRIYPYIGMIEGPIQFACPKSVSIDYCGFKAAPRSFSHNGGFVGHHTF